MHPDQRSLSRAAAFLCLIGSLVSLPAAAQEVVGTFTAPGGAPLSRSLVELVDSAGAVRASTMTDAAGGFRMGAGAPGTYRVRAERVGFSGSYSQVVTLEAGSTVQVRLVSNPAPVTLEAIVAEETPRCGPLSSEGAGLARVWDEARKALSLTAHGVGMEEYHLEQYRRRLNMSGQLLQEGSATERSVSRGARFGAAPLDTLLQHGFVREYGDSVAWDAPDADVLLADAFLETHCFRLRTDRGSPELVGLHFSPLPSRRVADVEGTLWLDRASSRLRHLEYRYVNAGDVARDARVGGRVEFDTILGGQWVVRRWYIRMPEVSPGYAAAVDPMIRSRTRTSERQPTYMEVGGELRPGPPPTAIAVLSGRVRNGITGAPLPGATVTVGTDQTARADSSGAFRIAGILPGEHPIVVRAAGFDSVAVMGTLRGNGGNSDFQMYPAPVVLSTIDVTALRSEFQARRARSTGSGVYMDASDFEGRARVSDALRRMPGMELVTNASTGGVFAISRSAQPSGSLNASAGGRRYGLSTGISVGANRGGFQMATPYGVCPIDVFVDGIRITGGGDDGADLNAYSPSSIEAVEFYKHPGSVPVQFRTSRSNCGTLVIWLKKDNSGS